MKRKIFLLFLTALLLFSGCASDKAPAEPDAGSVGPALSQAATPKPAEPAESAESHEQGSDSASAPEPEADSEPTAAVSSDTGGVPDVDLTQLSSTMVYAEVYNIVVSPEDYVGKTIKMRGQFMVYDGNPQNVDGSPYYFTVSISDATACCQQGIEFVWTGEHTFPEDYPEEGSDITVTGVFETYQEQGITYYHIVTDRPEAC